MVFYVLHIVILHVGLTQHNVKPRAAQSLAKLQTTVISLLCYSDQAENKNNLVRFVDINTVRIYVLV